MKNLSSAFKTVKSLITANSPVLLVGATIGGIVATGVLSAKAGYKARGIVDEAQAERDLHENSAPLTTQEKVSLTWLCYASPAITGTSAIASCLGVHLIHTKRHAALAGLYALTSTKLDDYREEAEKLLGTKKNQQLNDVMAQRSADGSPFINNEVVLVSDGTELCHDDLSGRWFRSNMNKIDAAINESNSLLVDEGDIDLNTVYDNLGLPPIPMGSDLGWSGQPIHVFYGACTTPDGQAALDITFREGPKPNLGRP